MGEPADTPMTADEFLLWCLDQEDRYELVEGVPVKIVEEVEGAPGEPPKMMTGASKAHDRMVVNIIIALGNQLRGSPCMPTTSDIALRTRTDSVRRPDAMVTCDPPDPDSYEVENVRLIVEVLSPSNRGIPWHRKLDEYWRLDAPDYVLLADSQAVSATLYARRGEIWDPINADTLDDILDLAAIDCRLAMSDVYDGLGFAGDSPDDPQTPSG